MKKTNSLFSLLAIGYLVLTSLGCTKTDSLGLAGNHDSGVDGIAPRGGSTRTGGATVPALGGTPSSGGTTPASGGMPASGGTTAPALGGMPTSGGGMTTTATGGTSGAGGVSSTGGSSSDAAARDGGRGDSGNVDATAAFCYLADGRRIEVGAVYADGCNCCACPSSGRAECQLAACLIDAGGARSCQTDQDCIDHGRNKCVFDPGCTSPRGTCMGDPSGVCPLFLIDRYPYSYCGCDGVTYYQQSNRQYPYQPYSHVGACASGGDGGTGGAGGGGAGGAGGSDGGSGVAALGGAGGSATGGSPGSGGISGSGGTAGVSSTGGSSSGGAGKDAGGVDRGNADSTTAVFCNLADGRRIEAGAVFADVDGCNCCVCRSDGTASCQGAMCIWKNDASSVPSPCQTDQDCVAQGRIMCVFDPGCTSPRGTCMAGSGICPTSAISDMTPSAYCGCDGVTYYLQSTKQYPDRPYSHVGACGSGGTPPDSGVSNQGGGTCPLLLMSGPVHYPSETGSPCPVVEPPYSSSCADSLVGVTCVYPSPLSPGSEDVFSCKALPLANSWFVSERVCKRTTADCLVDNAAPVGFSAIPGAFPGPPIELVSSCASRSVVSCSAVAGDTVQSALDNVIATLAANCLRSTGVAVRGALSVWFEGDCPTSFVVDPPELADCVKAQLESERLDCALGLVCGAINYVSIGCDFC